MIIGCKSQNETAAKKDYEIIYDEGIYVEQFDTTNISENRYTANNQTYLEGNKLIYDYYYEDHKGIKYKCSLLTRIRVGRSFLNEHSFTMGFSHSMSWEKCQATRESSLHFF